SSGISSTIPIGAFSFLRRSIVFFARTCSQEGSSGRGRLAPVPNLLSSLISWPPSCLDHRCKQKGPRRRPSGAYVGLGRCYLRPHAFLIAPERARHRVQHRRLGIIPATTP